MAVKPSTNLEKMLYLHQWKPFWRLIVKFLKYRAKAIFSNVDKQVEFVWNCTWYLPYNRTDEIVFQPNTDAINAICSSYTRHADINISWDNVASLLRPAGDQWSFITSLRYYNFCTVAGVPVKEFRQEAQLPQRNSASATHMEGG